MQNYPKLPDADFRLLFESAPAPQLVLLPNTQFTIVEVNRAYLRATKTVREGLLGRSLFDAFPDNPDDPKADGVANLRASLTRVMDTGLPDTMAFQRYDIPLYGSEIGSFEERYWSPINTPVFSIEGELLYIIHRVEDVTDFVRMNHEKESARNQARALQLQHDEVTAELVSRSRDIQEINIQLHQSESRLREAISIETVGVLFFSLDGTIHHANAAFTRMSGYSVAELKNLSSWAVLTDTDHEDITVRAAQELATRGETSPYEKCMIRKDGSTWWGLFAPKKISGEGRDSECVEFIIDITERKQAEEALHKADQRKDEFLAMLAHELRNPLAAIHNVTLLLETVSEMSQARNLVDILRRQAGTLEGLVADLLDVSRITRGLIELRQERVDLTEIVERALESVQGLINEKGHHVVTRLPGEPVWVTGDLVRLEQVLVNLLNNAGKYTDYGGRIELMLAHNGGQAELRVADNGVGMTPEVREKAFELFSQAERGLDRSDGGLGIGLTIVKNLVERHGGSIEAHSPGLGRGAEFVVCLPLAVSRKSPAALATSEEPNSAEGRSILIVEDSKDIAETMALLLEAAGHKTTVAHYGADALARVDEFAPDLILLDIGLPGMNGYEVAQRLRQHPRLGNAVIAALTGYGQHQDRERSAAAGFDAHFVKPVDIEALNAFIAGLQ